MEKLGEAAVYVYSADYHIGVGNASSLGPHVRYGTDTGPTDSNWTRSVEYMLKNGYRFYDLLLEYMPELATMQAFVNARANRAADYIVRAPVPCFVGATLWADYDASAYATTTQLVADIKAAVASAVNAVPMSAGSLAMSVITGAVSGVLGADGGISAAPSLSGTLHLPSGATHDITAAASLSVPADVDSDEGVTDRNVAYYAKADNVVVHLSAR